uniref:Uncharacterized protein n=1 Tax=Sinocyclocheilus grahami TaxID=75366 RepID=A0A672KI80_SINGR
MHKGCFLRIVITVYYFMSSSVQPKTKIGTNAQYAMAISVPRYLCTNEQSQIENVFSREEAEYVKDIITEGKTCVLCSASSNVIATRPNVVTGENSEHILLFPPGNSPMDTLLNNTDRNNCVVFYSSNTPCVETCVKSTENIFPGLANWTNVRKEGMNVFVFGNLRKYVGKETGNDFLIINLLMPLYRCTSTNVVECQNCLKDDAPYKHKMPMTLSEINLRRKVLQSLDKLNI